VSFLLTPAAMLIAAALTVPPLVLMYFLKLRRRQVPIASTFFWKQAVQDLTVNAPFQRLRRNLLLLLQLAVLLICAWALGQPILRREQTERRSLILLVDRSASMGVQEEDGQTRLERAKEEGRKLIEQMNTDDRAMVVTFSDRAHVVTPFTRSRAELLEGLDSIQQTQSLSRLAEAIDLVQAHAQTQIVPSRGNDTRIVNETPVHVVLLSDGRVHDADKVAVENMSIDLIALGAASDNVGIVSMQASREYERPELLNVVAVVQNFGPQPVTLDVELFIAGDHRDVQTVELGPGQAPPEGAEAPEFDASAAVRGVSFPAGENEELVFEGSGVIEVVLRRSDALPADNRSVAVVPPPREVAVLLVSGGNILLRHLLSTLPIQLTVMTPQAYEDAPEAQLSEGGRSRFDAVVFDDCSTARLPLGGYFFFGGLPQLEGFQRGEDRQPDVIFDWDDRHAVLRYVSPYDVYINGWHGMELPSNAVTLMQAGGGPALAAVNHQGNRFLISSFGLLDSSRAPNTNWPFRHHFLIFMDNAVQYLSGRLEIGIDMPLRPGDALPLRVPQGTARVQITRPDGSLDSVMVGDLTTAQYGRTDEVGVYTAQPTEDGTTSFAVNLFSPQESQILPNDRLTVGGAVVEGRAAVRVVNVPLWPLLLLTALAALLLEWAVYSRRVMV
jgi:Mg-chelatase subunit ChlD